MFYWMHIPSGYSLVMSADAIVNFLVTGLAIAWRIKSEMA